MVTAFRSVLVAGAACLTAYAAGEPSARAQATAVPQFSRCALRGTAEMPVDLPIYDEAGQVVARFSGGKSPLAASEFPSDASGRAKVETALGSGGFKIRGYVEASKIPLYTSYSVPVVTGHIWIRPNQAVTFVAGAPGKLKVQKAVTMPLHQTFSAWAPCSGLALSAGPPPGWDVPGDARGYVLKRDSLELFDDGAPGATLVATLRRSPAADGVLFFSTEQRGGFVHIVYQGQVTIDGWARSSDLSALPRGETMDQQAPPVVRRNAPRLGLANTPKVVKPTREIPLRVSAKDTAPVIGVIEPGTETYVMDVMAGWASVLPQSLHVTPPEGSHFWVKASDLGL